MNVVVAGGFERSGHDAMAEALAEEGVRRGHTVRCWNWREEHSAVGEHPVFHVHRWARRAGFAALADVMADKQLVAALVSDLGAVLRGSSVGDAKVILSVHPWGTLALAEWLSAVAGPVLVDCHSDFTPFPVFPHGRVDSFVGAGRQRLVSAEVARRQHVLGLPVRGSFSPAANARRSRTLVVNAGSDAGAIDQMATVVVSVTRLLRPKTVILLAPTQEAADTWGQITEIASDMRIATRVTDIGPLLCRACWFLTKGGGTPIAEGLVAGCRVFAVPTGIPWEDDSIAWLAMRGEVVPVGGGFPAPWSELLIGRVAELDSELRPLLAGAARAIWQHVEAGCPQRPIEALADLARKIIDSSRRVYQPDILPTTSAELRRVLGSWIA